MTDFAKILETMVILEKQDIRMKGLSKALDDACDSGDGVAIDKARADMWEGFGFCLDQRIEVKRLLNNVGS